MPPLVQGGNTILGDIVKIRLTHVITDREREAINDRYGLNGLASRKACLEFLLAAVEGALEDAESELN